jgi:hypothetical protein
MKPEKTGNSRRTLSLVCLDRTILVKSSPIMIGKPYLMLEEQEAEGRQINQNRLLPFLFY